MKQPTGELQTGSCHLRYLRHQRRSDRSSLHQRQGTVLALVCFTWAIAGVPGTLPRAMAQTVWDLKAGDRFSVETVIERETTVQLDNSPPNTVSSKERFVVQYRVQGIRATQAVFEVKFVSCELLDSGDNDNAVDGSASSSEKLKGISFDIRVAPDGVVDPVTDFDGILRSLSGVDERAESSLRRLFSEQAFRTFVSLPFWVAQPAAESNEVPEQWERMAETSLGPFGAMRHLVTITKDGENDLRIVAEHRHVPGKGSALSEDLQFDEVSASISEFSGSATLLSVADAVDEQSPDDDQGSGDDEKASDPQIVARGGSTPPFEQIRLEMTIGGKSALAIGSRQRAVSFTQKHRQTCRLLPGGWLRTPRLPFSDTPVR